MKLLLLDQDCCGSSLATCSPTVFKTDFVHYFKVMTKLILLISLYVFLCAGIVVGFERTTYMVNETDEQVELCVIVSVPEDKNIEDVTFSLAVDTQNGTAGMSNKFLS